MHIGVTFSEWCDLAVAAGTGLLAGATFWMARGTKQAVAVARRSAVATERLAQEGLRPVLVPVTGGLHVYDWKPGTIAGLGWCNYSITVKNAGPGTAIVRGPSSILLPQTDEQLTIIGLAGEGCIVIESGATHELEFQGSYCPVAPFDIQVRYTDVAGLHQSETRITFLTDEGQIAGNPLTLHFEAMDFVEDVEASEVRSQAAKPSRTYWWTKQDGSVPAPWTDTLSY